jgi:hypothetical protein
MEKRRDPRVNANWPLNAASLSGLSEGRTINISLSGVLFTIGAELTENALVLLHIKAGAYTVVECAARVVRTSSLGDFKTYGAEFCYISPADRQKLSFAILLLKEQPKE